jgi:AGZA family xanthine/uracil permease-like MFS transporter
MIENALERVFKIKAAGTSIRTEITAGVVTFMTMAYIIFVNPAIISSTGMDFSSAMAATCVSAALSTLLMGLYANYPIALAPGMGENAFFAYTVCLAMGIPWQVALGCVFIEGLLFVLLTLLKVREQLVNAIPDSIKYGTACGIGLLIAFVGLKEAGVIVSSPATFVALGNLLSPPTVLAAFGLLLTGALIARKVKGAIFWGIIVTAAAGMVTGLIKYQGIAGPAPSMAPTFMKMDIAGAFRMGLLTVIFVFLFMDVFDTVGTLAGVAEIGGFFTASGGKKQRVMPRVNRCLMSDAVGTVIGAACGTPTVTSYIESASGIAEGGRTGLANMVTGALFILALFFAPLVRMVAGGFEVSKGVFLHPVTAPALIIVGCLMMLSIVKIDWRDISEAIPAFMTMILMPLTFSIANGLAIGFISYSAIKILSGRAKEVSWLISALSALFILRFVYLRMM